MSKFLLKSPFFWISTLITLIIVIGLGLFVLPPMLGQIKENKAKSAELDTALANHEEFLRTVIALEKNPQELEQLHALASLSLPVEPQPEILILQLEGLLKSAELKGLSLNVPLAVATKGNEGPSKADFSINGPMSYSDTKKLLIKLRTLSRWNKITSVEITRNTTESATTISGSAFYKPGGSKEFSGQANFLQKARELFANVETYTTIPDVTTEGNFGKTDPFE